MPTPHIVYEWLSRHWPVIGPALAVVAYLTAEALLKMSSRFKANSPVEAVANVLVNVLPKWIPVVAKAAGALATPDLPATSPPKIADAVTKVALVLLAFTVGGCDKVEIGSGVLVAVIVAAIVTFALWERNRIAHLAIVFALLAGTAHAQVAPGIASDVIAPPAPPRDPGMVAQAAPSVRPDRASAAPPVSPAPIISHPPP